MKKFRFKLQPLERHRKMIEEERRVSLSKALTEMRSVESELLVIDDGEVRARRAYASLGEMGGRDSLTSSQFWVIDKFIQGQKVRRVLKKQELEKKEAVVQYNHSEFVKAKQSLRVIETLHEKEHTKYKKELQRYEMKQLDDIYTMRDRLSEKRKNNQGSGENE